MRRLCQYQFLIYKWALSRVFWMPFCPATLSSSSWGSRSVPSPDEVCNLSSEFWVCPGVYSQLFVPGKGIWSNSWCSPTILSKKAWSTDIIRWHWELLPVWQLDVKMPNANLNRHLLPRWSLNVTLLNPHSLVMSRLRAESVYNL